MIHLNSKDKIMKWLLKNKVYNFEIDENLVVHSSRHVSLYNLGLKTIPVQFGEIAKSFQISKNLLTNLRGAPQKCENFYCSHNHLISLEFSPASVNGAYICHDNLIQTTQFVPLNIQELNILNNPIKNPFLYLLHHSRLKILHLNKFQLEPTLNIPDFEFIFDENNRKIYREDLLHQLLEKHLLQKNQPSNFSSIIKI